MENILEPEAIKALTIEHGNDYAGIAYDGQFLYLTLPQRNQIHKFNMEFTLVQCFDTDRAYSDICYDNTENCFWTLDDEKRRIIFKLDCNLKEIGCLHMSGGKNSWSSIVGLSYNCETDNLVVAFSNIVANFAKDGCMTEILLENNNGTYTGILSAAPYYFITRICGDLQYIDVWDSSERLIRCIRVSGAYQIAAIVLDVGSFDQKDKISFIILASKHCLSYLLNCTINACGVEFCSCNFRCCHNTCKCPNGQGDCICDLIESVALVETALSHILNAEGEKLQKAIKISNNVCDLLSVNKSVNKTITNVTFLEQILYGKLQVIEDLKLKDCCKCSKE